MEAELVIGLATRFRALPVAGGILDQPSSLLTMLRVMDLAEGESGPVVKGDLDLADLQELLG